MMCEILVLAGLDPALRGQLLDLALGDHRRGARQDPEHLEAAVLDHQLEAAREQEVADQNRGRIAPDDVGGALAAPEARAVDDVVVEQGRGVDEFHRRGEPVVARARIIEQPRAGQSQHRPHPLAAAGDQVAGELGDQGDVALHAIEDDRVDMVEIGRDELDHRVERRRGAGPQGNDGGIHGSGDVRRGGGKGKGRACARRPAGRRRAMRKEGEKAGPAPAPYAYRGDPEVPAFDDSRPLIVFDGDCVFCSRSMRLVARADRAGRFRMAPAQQPLGQALYRHIGLPTDRFDTYLVLIEGRLHQRSDALIAMAALLPWPWRAARLLRLVPRRLRDAGYGLIARHRYRLFGRRPACGLADPALSGRLL